MIHYILLCVSLAAQAGAVVFGKKASMSVAEFRFDAVFGNPYYLLSLACLAAQALAWPFALRHFRLLFAYSFMSAVYPLILVLSHYVFKEPVSPMNIAGALIIMAGVSVFIASGDKEAGDHA